MLPEIWTDITFCYFGSKFRKMKKTPGYIILLHMCTINEDHMMYGMECNRQNFFFILVLFLSISCQQPKNSKF